MYINTIHITYLVERLGDPDMAKIQDYDYPEQYSHDN